MPIHRPIVLVEDDQDDREIFERILKDLQIPYACKWFFDAATAMEYLHDTQEQVFLIFCDINLPGISGLEFKQRIDSDPMLRTKSIPFVFFSTSTSQRDINAAYIEMTIQGFFKKGTNYQEMKSMIGLIVEYWTLCRHPNAV